MSTRIPDAEVKQILLELLIKFTSFCDDNNINYYLAYGTLLGAVRHRGYIPWDDDIDLFIFRSDLDILVNSSFVDENIGLKGEPFTLGAINIFDRYRFYDKRTKVLHNNVLDEVGISLDIFVLDVDPNTFVDRIKKRILEYIILIKSITPRIDRSLIKSLIITLLRWIADAIPGTKIESEYAKVLSNIDLDKTTKVTVTNDPYRKGPYSFDIFRKSVQMQFEGIPCSVPVGYAELLTQIYNEYMKLPPEDKRYKEPIEAYWKKD